MRNLIKLLNLYNIRRYCSLYTRQKVLQDEDVLQKIEEMQFKPRKHPGINPIKLVSVPSSIVTSIENVLEDYPVKKLVADGEILTRHLKGRVPPMEHNQITDLRDELYSKILKKEEKQRRRSEESVDEEKLKQRIKDKLTLQLKLKVYNWKPITYDLYTSLTYLVARFAPEYAVLVKILAEIRQRDATFVPRSMFDFGSGVGTAMWAVNHHWEALFEYFNVDSSAFMNDISQLLLQGGRTNKSSQIKGVYYRQFFPMANNYYDLVISAYSLLELPSVDARLGTALKLWNKTGRYLIFVEQGTNAGFRVINEVRDYLLHFNNNDNTNDTHCHVFSPCPHDFACPRFMFDKTPCNFQVAYNSLALGARAEHKHELYSYVILAKGKRKDNQQWPRVVRESLVRSKHTICRLCSKNGTLDEVIITAAKHGKTTYHCARATKWGDRLPVHLKPNDQGGITE